MTFTLIASPVAAAGTATQNAAEDCLAGCLEDPTAGGDAPSRASSDSVSATLPGLGKLVTQLAVGQGSGDRLAKDGPGLGQSDAFLTAKKAFLKAKKAFVTNPDNMAPEWVPGGGVAYDGKQPVSVMPGDRVDVGGISVMPGDNVSIGDTVVTDPENMAPGQGDRPSDPTVKSD